MYKEMDEFLASLREVRNLYENELASSDNAADILKQIDEIEALSKIHRVKSWCYLYQAAIDGLKTHDIRDLGDRDYKVGDTLILCEFDQTTGKFTGRETPFTITYITDRDTPCALSSAVLKPGYGILSIKKI